MLKMAIDKAAITAPKVISGGSAPDRFAIPGAWVTPDISAVPLSWGGASRRAL